MPLLENRYPPRSVTRCFLVPYGLRGSVVKSFPRERKPVFKPTFANPILANPFLPSQFWSVHFWSKLEVSDLANFGQSNFGQSILGQCVCVVVCVVVCFVCCYVVVLLLCCVVVVVVVVLLLCCCCCRVVVVLLSCPRRLRQPKNSKRANLRASLRKHHQKFHEKRRHPERDKKSENGCGRGKKARNFGPSTLRGPTLRGIIFFWVWPPTLWDHDTHQIQKWIGPNWSNQDGQNGIGQSRSLQRNQVELFVSFSKKFHQVAPIARMSQYQFFHS